MVRASGNHFALEHYSKRAGVYDLELADFELIRRNTIERLQLPPPRRHGAGQGPCGARPVMYVESICKERSLLCLATL
jgi:hypothetical protein